MIATKVHLSDFGAAFAYDRTEDYAVLVERIEMRAFAHLLDEMERILIVQEETESTRTALVALADACRQDSYTFSKAQELWKARVSV